MLDDHPLKICGQDYDRILKTAMDEFEAGLMRLVEREFEALRGPAG